MRARYYALQRLGKMYQAYNHIEIVVAFLVVTMFSFLIIASYGVGDMTWEFGEMFSYASSTFLYLSEAKIQAITPSLLPSQNCLEKH